MDFNSYNERRQPKIQQIPSIRPDRCSKPATMAPLSLARPGKSRVQSNRKEHIMNKTAIIAVLVTAGWIFTSAAQDNDRFGSQMRRPGMNQGGPGGKGGMPPPGLAILKALDKNGDKVIDNDEIAHSPAALKSLDRNDDGKLTPDEIMARPQQQGGEEGRGRPDREMGRGPGREGCEDCSRGERERRQMGNRGEQRRPEGMGDRPGRGGEERIGRGGEGMGPQQGGPGREGGMRPPIPPVIQALDPNGDRVVDADEIANIQSAIKKLDRNGDGRLTLEELLPRPPRPPEGEERGPEGRGDRDRRGRGGDRQGPPPNNQNL